MSIMTMSRFLRYDVSMTVASYRLNIVEVYTLLVQSEVLVPGSVGSFGPLEGRGLLVIMIVTMSVTADPRKEGQANERHQQLHVWILKS